MKYAALIVFALVACTICAQEDTVEPADLIQSARDFIEENLDPEALDALGVDQGRIQQFLAQLQQRFDGSYVFDLAALEPTATNILPVLRQFEETEPYAAWLETRLDYLEILGPLRRESQPTNAIPGTQPPNPSPSVERKVWTQLLDRRPIPPQAQKFVPLLKPIFIEEHVPPELVWLAEVESSFNPSARSPAGAVGLFQLMPATAKSLQLSLWPRDQRLQPEKNARAAAAYLRKLHGRFDDWELALAAYNAGETRVSNLLDRRSAHTFDAIANDLPAETQMYVPKIEATIRKREGTDLAELKLP